MRASIIVVGECRRVDPSHRTRGAVISIPQDEPDAGSPLEGGGEADGGAELGAGSNGFGVTAAVGATPPGTVTREDLERGETTGVPRAAGDLGPV